MCCSCNYFNLGNACDLGTPLVSKTKAIIFLFSIVCRSETKAVSWNPISTSILISLPAFCFLFDRMNVARHFHSDEDITMAFDANFAQLLHVWLRKTENHLNRTESKLFFKVGIWNVCRAIDEYEWLRVCLRDLWSTRRRKRDRDGKKIVEWVKWRQVNSSVLTFGKHYLHVYGGYHKHFDRSNHMIEYEYEFINSVQCKIFARNGKCENLYGLEWDSGIYPCLCSNLTRLEYTFSSSHCVVPHRWLSNHN